ERDDGNRIGLAVGREPSALEWVDGDVHPRPRAVPDALPVVQHRRLVLLPLSDHHNAVHGHRVEHEPHGIHRGLVGGVLVPSADPARRPHGGRLGYADELEREVPVGRLSHGYILSGASTPTSERQRAITTCVARQSPSLNASASPEPSTRWWW